MAKLHAEQIIVAHKKSQVVAGFNFSFALLRYFNVVGADPQGRYGAVPNPKFRRWGRIVDACFEAAVEGSVMTLYGDDFPTPDGTPVRDYIHVWDLVHAHLRVLQGVCSRVPQQLVYNIGIGRGYSNKQVIDACAAVTGRRIATRVGPRRAGDPAVTLGDATLLRRDTGWEGKRSQNLTASIEDAWRWKQALGQEWRKYWPN
mmetsp:Transcript_15936/g.31247  ORF Transcript_15936/g.31247 Transcript_15936/m.31247 type:complete len:202 (-) Transcript_15936:174-779(-)